MTKNGLNLLGGPTLFYEQRRGSMAKGMKAKLWFPIRIDGYNISVSKRQLRKLRAYKNTFNSRSYAVNYATRFTDKI